MLRKYPGYLITFEGPEGGGKTTIAPLVYEYIEKELKLPTVYCWEPGSTKIGTQIRSILMDPQNKEMDAKTETFLFQAARAQISKEIIKPALLERKIVIMDRFCDSSSAYQGFARGLGMNKIRDFNNFSTGGIIPDLTFLYDVEVETGLRRKKGIGEWNRLDMEEIDFHKKVRQGFHFLVENDKNNRWVIINTENLSPSEVCEQTKKIVGERLTFNGFIEKLTGLNKESER